MEDSSGDRKRWIEMEKEEASDLGLSGHEDIDYAINYVKEREEREIKEKKWK